jgi:hypothetical protein
MHTDTTKLKGAFLELLVASVYENEYKGEYLQLTKYFLSEQ